jgi:hypothetical protein
MTDDLATALHTMADSGQPPVMDVERVLHEGRRSLVRRRMAALGGGTAVLAVSALLVGSLTGMGSGVQSGTDSAAAATFTVDPHDPVVTHWQFAYIPSGMVAYGGVDTTDEQVSTVLESESDRFALELIPMQAPIVVGRAKGESAPTQKVPVEVPGTTTAYWLGYGNDRITLSNGEGGEMAELTLQLKSGQWLEILVNNLDERNDWKAQTLKAATSLVHKDRSVPMPFQLAEALPQSFVFRGGTVMRNGGATTSDIMYRLGPENKPIEDIVSIGASTTRWATGSSDSNPNDASVCKDSKGLTLCVTYPKAEPAELKAIGGPQALLDRVTSLGTDPADWTTDVIH